MARKVLMGTTAASLLTGAGTSAPAWAQASTAYDGSYAGSVTLLQDLSTGRRQLCDVFDPNDPRRTLTVQNGAFSFLISPAFSTVVRGTVGADGSLTGSGVSSIGAITLTGKITGGAFTGEARSATCTVSVRLTKK